PHGDAAAGGKAGGVHSHGAVHAARQGQPGVVDGGAERRRALRRAGRVSLPQAEPRVRAHADRQPDQSGHGDRAPDRLVGSGRLAGDPRQPAGDSDRGIADLRDAALPAGAGRADPRAQARGGRVSEPRRDGGDVGRGVGAAVRRCRRGAARARTRVRDAGCRLGAIGPRRRSRAPRQRVVPPGDGSAARGGLGALWRGAAAARGRAAAAAGRGGGEETVVGPRMEAWMILVLAIVPAAARAQDSSVLRGSLPPGSYAVGYRTSFQRDSTRPWRTAEAGRPIRISIWYPAVSDTLPAMTYGDYFHFNGPADFRW